MWLKGGRGVSKRERSMNDSSERKEHYSPVGHAHSYNLRASTSFECLK